ncbi:hypothetical protein IJ098_01360 [Candidatus Saccharibacteria bacterium]|nr:hypothetical protein [Candidatus Saccharibacteria bacterium]
MKKAILVVSIILVSMLAGCGNASATSQQANVAPEKSSNDYEAPTTAPVEESSKESIDVQTTTNEGVISSREEGIATADQPDISWQDYIDSDGVFNMDNYAEALGYTVIKADKSHSWYIFDTVNYHYCIVASGPTLNVMFDSYNVGYAINIVDDRDNSLTAKICTQSQTVTTSEQWINESSDILKYITTNSPSDEDFHNCTEVKTLHLLCTKWSECFITDERGVVIDTNGTAEQIWNRNWEND